MVLGADCTICIHPVQFVVICDFMPCLSCPGSSGLYSSLSCLLASVTVTSRAANDPSVFTIKEKAPTMAFF